MNYFEYLDSMFLAIERGFTLAWHEGMRTCNILPEDMTQEENQRLRELIDEETGYAANLGDDIVAGSRENGGRLRDLTRRIPMWVNKLLGIRDLAKTYACADQKLEWVVNPAKEHCVDCLRLSGRVHRASVWRKSGWWTKSPVLACGGFKCGCELRPTDKPGSRGKLPLAV